MRTISFFAPRFEVGFSIIFFFLLKCQRREQSRLFITVATNMIIYLEARRSQFGCPCATSFAQRAAAMATNWVRDAFGCCSETPEGGRPEDDVSPVRNDQHARVLMLASSDVLHAILSPYVHVELIDVRSPEDFRRQRIEKARSFPLPDLDLLAQDGDGGRAALRNIVPATITAGALAKAFSSRTRPTSQVGTCLIVYDSQGDTVDSVGPATKLADRFAELGLVPEVLTRDSPARPASGGARALHASGAPCETFCVPLPSWRLHVLTGGLCCARRSGASPAGFAPSGSSCVAPL